MPEKNYCEIARCGRELPPGTGSKGGPMICARCYSSRTYYRRLGQDALVQRAEQLEFWRERIDYLAPMIAKNIKKVREQLAELHEQTARSTAERLRQAKALTKNMTRASGNALRH